MHITHIHDNSKQNLDMPDKHKHACIHTCKTTHLQKLTHTCTYKYTCKFTHSPTHINTPKLCIQINDIQAKGAPIIKYIFSSFAVCEDGAAVLVVG